MFNVDTEIFGYIQITLHKNQLFPFRCFSRRFLLFLGITVRQKQCRLPIINKFTCSWLDTYLDLYVTRYIESNITTIHFRNNISLSSVVRGNMDYCMENKSYGIKSYVITFSLKWSLHMIIKTIAVPTNKLQNLCYRAFYAKYLSSRTYDK